jgi:hypothetical protein
MSKLKALIAIPIALLGVKRLQETVIDDPNPKSIIPTTAPDRPKQRDDGTFFGL